MLWASLSLGFLRSRKNHAYRLRLERARDKIKSRKYPASTWHLVHAQRISTIILLLLLSSLLWKAREWLLSLHLWSLAQNVKVNQSNCALSKYFSALGTSFSSVRLGCEWHSLLWQATDWMTRNGSHAPPLPALLEAGEVHSGVCIPSIHQEWPRDPLLANETPTGDSGRPFTFLTEFRQPFCHHEAKSRPVLRMMS